MSESDKELKAEIRQLTRAIEKSNNLWWSFVRGAMSGFGVFVGSAILVGLLIVILTRIEGWAFIGHYAHNIMELIRQNSGK